MIPYFAVSNVDHALFISNSVIRIVPLMFRHCKAIATGAMGSTAALAQYRHWRLRV
jgi:hypothetical protein